MTTEALIPMVMPEAGPSTSLVSEVVNGIKPIVMVVSLADDKNSDDNQSGGPEEANQAE